MQKQALRLPPLPWCDASFLILEMLKLNDEVILITSWETKTTFRWVAWLHSNSLLFLVCSPKIPILPSKSPWIHIMTSIQNMLNSIWSLISLWAAVVLPESSLWKKPTSIKGHMLSVVKKLEAHILCSTKLSLVDGNKCCQLYNSHHRQSSCDYLQAAFESLPVSVGSCILVGGSLNRHLHSRAPLLPSCMWFCPSCSRPHRHSILRLALLSWNNVNTEEL